MKQIIFAATLFVVTVFVGVLALGLKEYKAELVKGIRIEKTDVIYTGHNFRVYEITDPKTGTEYLVNSNGGLVKR